MPSTTNQAIAIFVVVCTILFLLMLSFIIVIIQKYQRKQILYLEKLREIQLAFENKILLSQLEIQERTFETISKEIHDNIGQKLTLAKLNLNTIPKKITQFPEKIYDSIFMIGDAIGDLRNLSKSMNSELILISGLVTALENEVSQLRRYGDYEINLDVNGEGPFLDEFIELSLFRIVQESIQNIIKHANAHAVIIKIDFSANCVILDIIDDGVGFVYATNSSSGMGLSNIQKRVTAMKADLILETSPGKGTRLQIKIPII